MLSESGVATLQRLFPGHSADAVRGALRTHGGNVPGAIDALLRRSPNVSQEEFDRNVAAELDACLGDAEEGHRAAPTDSLSHPLARRPLVSRMVAYLRQPPPRRRRARVGDPFGSLRDGLLPRADE